MKALVYTGPETIEYRDVDVPTTQADDVLVKVDAVGICGSDMHAYLGHDERRIAPLILGHEAAGVVKSGRLSGKRVVINPLVTCGHCSACQTGRSNLCSSREIISMAPRQGAFAEFVAIPERNLIEVPDGMEMATAALVEPIATGWHAVVVAGQALHRPLAEAKALVFGGGAVGLAAALSLKAQGCQDIVLAETNASRRETVLKAGITPFDPMNDKGPEENTIDVVIDCVGANPTRSTASKVIKPGGVITHVGLLDAADGLDIRKITLQEVTFIGTYTYTMEDFRACLAAMNSGALGKLDWFEQRTLADGKAAFADLLAGRTGVSKIILRPETGA